MSTSSSPSPLVSSQKGQRDRTASAGGSIPREGDTIVAGLVRVSRRVRVKGPSFTDRPTRWAAKVRYRIQINASTLICSKLRNSLSL